MSSRRPSNSNTRKPTGDRMCCGGCFRSAGRSMCSRSRPRAPAGLRATRVLFVIRCARRMRLDFPDVPAIVALEIAVVCTDRHRQPCRAEHVTLWTPKPRRSQLRHGGEMSVGRTASGVNQETDRTPLRLGEWTRWIANRLATLVVRLDLGRRDRAFPDRRSRHAAREARDAARRQTARHHREGMARRQDRTVRGFSA
jgi:hypothetical protein